MLKYLVLLLAFAGGCSYNVARPAPSTVILNETNHLPKIIRWSNYGDFVTKNTEWMWYEEACKRFKDPVLFFCHGNSDYELYPAPNGWDRVSGWYLFPDAPRRKLPVKYVAWFLHNAYPDRDIILIVCNPKGERLYVPRVWYPMGNVWLFPDAYVYYDPWDLLRDDSRKDNDVGSIWEFVSYDGRPEGEATTQPATRPTTQGAK